VSIPRRPNPTFAHAFVPAIMGASANFTLALEILLGKDAVGPSFYSGAAARDRALSALNSEKRASIGTEAKRIEIPGYFPD
jgi:hypothetical protein